MIFTRTLHGSHPALAPILASKDFRRFLIAQGTSSIGDWVATVALISLVWGRTHSSGAVGGLIALRLLPALLVGPAAGALADRADRRRLMVVCDLGRAGVAVAVPFVSLGSVFVLAFLMEVLSLVFGPPRDASVPRLVPKRSLGAANALVTGAAYGTLPLGAAGYAGLAALAARGSFRALPRMPFRCSPTLRASSSRPPSLLGSRRLSRRRGRGPLIGSLANSASDASGQAASASFGTTWCCDGSSQPLCSAPSGAEPSMDSVSATCTPRWVQGTLLSAG